MKLRKLQTEDGQTKQTMLENGKSLGLYEPITNWEWASYMNARNLNKTLDAKTFIYSERSRQELQYANVTISGAK